MVVAHTSSMTNAKNQLETVLDSFSTTMLTTHCEVDGETAALRSRPMHIAGREGFKKIYFVTSREAELIEELKKSPQVALVFADGTRFLSMSATAAPLEDPGLRRSLWNPAMDVWFEDGMKDDSVQLIEAVPTRAEYWDMGGTTRVRFAFEMLKALVTGEKIEPSTDNNAHGTVTLA